VATEHDYKRLPRPAPPAHRVAIVADDLTGAADAALAFASRGFTTHVALAPAGPPSAAVVARFSGGRDLPEAEAVRLAEVAIRAIRANGEPEIWYQKIDSVLRGHPGAELATGMAELGLERALVAPALPAEGRTVVDGRLRVRGRPLTGSPLGTRTSPLVADRFRAHVGGPIVHLSAKDLDDGPSAILARLAECDHGVVVADGRDDADLLLLARTALTEGPLLLCGSAGLAQAVAATLAAGRIESDARSSPPRPSATRPILVVAGSHHPATARQVGRLEADGAIVLRPTRLAPDDDPSALGELALDAAAGLAAGRTVVLTAIACPEVRLSGAAIAERLAGIAARPEVLAAAGGAIATGGEVAAALFRAAGATALHLHGGVRSTIPWGVLEGGIAAGMPVVTKAGSFGDDRTLTECAAFLRGAESSAAPPAERIDG
jgi:uncharacterized protein YgbK (DUF1537 family)